MNKMYSYSYYYHSQPHSVGSHRINFHHSCRTCSTGRPIREDLRPNGNPFWAQCTMYWALDTQAASKHSLAPPSSVLVAQYCPECNPVRPQLLSLCHVQNSSPYPYWQAGPSAHPTEALVPYRGRFCHQSP